MKHNYHKMMMGIIHELDSKKERPKLLLHSCCAPCSSYVLELLRNFFDIEILFFNPNIAPEQEYAKRFEEQVRLVEEMGLNYQVIEAEQESRLFYEAIKGCEALGEGSERCIRCFTLRLDKAARYAKTNRFDFFTTTLTISPKKNAEMINKIGLELGNQYQTRYLVSDFKKNNGYKCSVDLSKKYHLYRQNYCGCVFSKQEALWETEKKGATNI